ncbi:MAG TPA: transglycosylase SLT domain-containing protein [Bacteroidia bacterium]|nr:transglycosylase SLT domain-containing protein [Bacteroidia bacterium]
MKRKANRKSKKYTRWYKYLLALFVIVTFAFILNLIALSLSGNRTDTDFRNAFLSHYKFNGVTLPKDMNFCGEAVPLDDFTVREELEKQLMLIAFNQPSTMLLNKKAARWFPVIEPILKKNGVPEDFKYIAIIESGLVNSPDQPKAGGFWQLQIPVAQYYGLEVNDEVDERFNIEKSTDAACKCFLDAYRHYHSWTLAAASYDMGMGALDKMIDKQKTSDYYQLFLNEETSQYVYRLLAFKEIITRPKSYGYSLKPSQLYAPIPVHNVKVDSSVSDLAAFAVKKGSTYKILKLLNPWLLKSSLTNPAHKTYYFQFPAKGAHLYGFETFEKNDSVPDSVKPDIIVTDTLRAPRIYVVKEKDTWESIATAFGTDTNLLLKWNRRDGHDQPSPGEELVIPAK